MASQPDLECGFSRELFVKWCSNRKNSIILTQRSASYTLSNRLIEIAAMQVQREKVKKEQNSMEVDEEKDIVKLEIKERVPLKGEELIEYNEQLRNQMAEDSKLKKENYDTDEDDDDEENEMSTLDNLNKSTQKPEEFFKQNLLEKKNYPIYPLVETKIKWDEYGEMINSKDFVIFEKNETNVDLSGDPEQMKTNDELNEITNELPTKCISRMESLIVLATIRFIDFEGISFLKIIVLLNINLTLVFIIL